jgi:Flp pilus assembly protein TadD
VKAEIVHAQILRIKGNPGAALAHLYAVRDDLDVEDSELSKLYEDTVARCIRDQADLAACCEFYNFGLFQAQRGHYEEARQSLAKALEIVPHHAQTHALLGKIFHALRIRDEARYHLSRALAVDPTNVSASRMMARMDWLRFRLPVERWLSSLNITPQVAASVFVVVVLILIALAALLNRG